MYSRIHTTMDLCVFSPCSLFARPDTTRVPHKKIIIFIYVHMSFHLLYTYAWVCILLGLPFFHLWMDGCAHVTNICNHIKGRRKLTIDALYLCLCRSVECIIIIISSRCRPSCRHLVRVDTAESAWARQLSQHWSALSWQGASPSALTCETVLYNTVIPSHEIEPALALAEQLKAAAISQEIELAIVRNVAVNRNPATNDCPMIIITHFALIRHEHRVLSHSREQIFSKIVIALEVWRVPTVTYHRPESSSPRLNMWKGMVMSLIFVPVFLRHLNGT